MSLRISAAFLEDLRDIDDPNFARRVLAKVIGRNGKFLEDADDHRYDGIDGAWIRYVSRGNTAFRVIFIRLGGDVLLFRAGRHDVEDRLSGPKAHDQHIEVDAALESKPNGIERMGADFGEMLYTSTPTQLKHFITSLSTVSHREIYLVSPFLTLEMLKPNDKFGRLIFKAKEDGAAICLITLPPKTLKDLEPFQQLEAEGMAVGFVERLHSKLYIFDIADEEKYKYGSHRRSAALLGSANLTHKGFGLDDGLCNEELCYRVPDSKLDTARKYATWLYHKAKDPTAYRRILR